jgi:hypothetical protein
VVGKVNSFTSSSDTLGAVAFLFAVTLVVVAFLFAVTLGAVTFLFAVTH